MNPWQQQSASEMKNQNEFWLKWILRNVENEKVKFKYEYELKLDKMFNKTLNLMQDWSI